MTIVELNILLSLGFTIICGAAAGAYFYGPLGLVGGAVAGFFAYLVLTLVCELSP